MKKILKKTLAKINISKRVENITLFVVLIVCLILSVIFNNAYVDSKNQTFKNNAEALLTNNSNEITKYIDDLFRDISAIAVAISKNGDESVFNNYIEEFKDDFNVCEYAGIYRNGTLVKEYFPNGAYSIVADELNFTYDKIGYSYSKHGGDITYFIDKANDICALAKQPIYFDIDGSKQYLGEVVFRCNLTDLFESHFDLSKFGMPKETPYKATLILENDNQLTLFSQNEDKLKNIFSFEAEDENTHIQYTFDESVLGSVDASYVIRVVGLIIMIFAIIFLLKILLTILRTRRELDSINDVKLDFFTNIVYEVVTSASSIIGFCNEAERENESQTVSTYLNNSKVELNKLLHKINNLLDITNITEGKLNSFEEEYFIHLLIKEIEDEYAQVVSDKDIKMIIDIADDTPIKLKGQKTVIKKAINHIIENSLSMIIDGHIKLAVSTNFINNRKNVVLKVVITDTGIGIKNESVKDIFQADNLKETSTSDESKIELAIAVELIKSIGGDLKIVSEYGKGTVYTITINQKVIDDRTMNEDMYNDLQEKFRRNLGTLKKVNANILVVDDNEVNLTVLRNIIKTFGADVDSAKSGAIAVELAQAKNYDLMFIDYLMPDMDGIETLYTIRNINKYYKQAPAVLVSANTFSNENEFKDNGFDDYLPKPISQKDIEKCLKTLLNVELIECEQMDV